MCGWEYGKLLMRLMQMQWWHKIIKLERIVISIKRIIRNMIKCKNCGEVIESTSVHDFKFCSCGNCAVDGGHDYLKRSYKNSRDDFEELSVVENIDETNN